MNTFTLTTQQTSAADVLARIDRANLAESSKRKYTAAVMRYLDAGGDLFDAQALGAFPFIWRSKPSVALTSTLNSAIISRSITMESPDARYD